jgi:uncharacterized protein (TIGR00288 family)
MNSRHSRHAPSRPPVTPVHRGPQAIAQAQAAPFQHAPNAALLIDFDNVTMGIRSDLASELRSLLSSEIIKGKVAVQRAYADWRRYPQYIVPLAESSIDMIMAPAYGSSKKNATDIRLAVDAIELVFTRPEIGTYILLSGDSDFASMVTKLKEYGKYVIGVGIRESSSDLLVMNCDEYYSYNALAGLVKSGEEELVKWDPWELVTEAINRMVKNGDVMRSDRLKQVMQDIDPQFDEKNLGMSKFSKFCQEAAAQGLIKVIKLENGQLEVAPADGLARPAEAEAPRPPRPGGDREERGRRGRRGGRGGGRGRDREERERPERETPVAVESVVPALLAPVDAVAGLIEPPEPPAFPRPAAAMPEAADGIGRGGERLTRDEAFALVKRAAESLTDGVRGKAVPAAALRRRAFELLGRDSESLNERFFTRVLRDAHDADQIDLRRRGDDYEVSLPGEVAPVAEQLNRAAAARSSAQAAVTAAGAAPAGPRGMGPRGIPGRGRVAGRLTAPPPELLAVGVVEEAPAPQAPEGASTDEPPPEKPPARRRGSRGSGSRKTKAAASAGDAGAEAKPPGRGRPRRGAGRSAKGGSGEVVA